MADPSWCTLEELKNDQTLDGALTDRDDEALNRVLVAAMSWVQDHRRDLDYHGAWSVPAEVRPPPRPQPDQDRVRRLDASRFEPGDDRASHPVRSPDTHEQSRKCRLWPGYGLMRLLGPKFLSLLVSSLAQEIPGPMDRSRLA